MKIHCLIIEPDQKNHFEYNLLFRELTDIFQPTIVTDSKSAIKTLEVSNFSIIICDPTNIGHDIKQLKLFLLETKYITRMIFVCSNSLQDNKSFANCFVFSELIKRPLTPAKLAGKILVALKNIFFQRTMTESHLTAALQLIEPNNLTCTLLISVPNSNDDGLIFFNKSTPVDAQYGNLQTDMALRRMFSLENITIKMYSICPVKENRLHTNCSKIILDCSAEQQKAACTPKNPDKPNVTGIANLFMQVKKDTT